MRQRCGFWWYASVVSGMEDNKSNDWPFDPSAGLLEHLSFLFPVCSTSLWRHRLTYVSQGEGSDGAGSPRLPGGAGHPASVGWWRTAAADHQPGHQLCIWPVSRHRRGAVLLKRSVYSSVWWQTQIYIFKCNTYILPSISLGSCLNLPDFFPLPDTFLVP